MAPTEVLAALSPVTSHASTAPPPVRVGTRRSMLARVQTDIVCKELKKAWPDRKYEIHAIESMGDKDQNTALHAFNAKALWTTELEELLETRELDMIVHSLKDMPTQLPLGMTLGSIFPRASAKDALVVSPRLVATHKSLSSLPEGSVIGTSSLRRQAQLRRAHPHLKFADCRGNVGTRLSKLDHPESPFAALILAAAGLTRLGQGNRITSLLSFDDGGMMHAVGQGAIGVEIRSDDEESKTLLAKVGCEFTTRACLAERSLMRTLEGGCSVPIGVETEWVRKTQSLGSTAGSGVGVGAKPAAEYDKLSGVAVSGPEGSAETSTTTSAPTATSQGSETTTSNVDEDDRTDELIMRAIVVSIDGQKAVQTILRRRIESREDADQFGWDVASKLVEQGAEDILKEITLNRKIIGEDDGA